MFTDCDETGLRAGKLPGRSRRYARAKKKLIQAERFFSVRCGRSEISSYKAIRQGNIESIPPEIANYKQFSFS